MQFQICGPKHLAELDKLNDFAGIYVWGFMCNRQNQTYCDFTNYSTEYDGEILQFIPYYVGLSTHSVKKRLLEHSLIRSMDSAKFIRFSRDFMSQFFKYVPDQYGKKDYLKAHKEIATEFPGSITYYNKRELMKEMYQSSIDLKKIEKVLKRGEAGIAEFDFITDIDTLDVLINKKNNFYFIYIEVHAFESGINKLKEKMEVISEEKKKKKKTTKTNKNLNPTEILELNKVVSELEEESGTLGDQITRKEKEKKTFLESMEKKVYLSLKGGTISRYTKSRSTENLKIEDKTGTGVFELNANLLSELSPDKRKVDLSKNPWTVRDGYFSTSHTSPETSLTNNPTPQRRKR
jgi:hypothetical protein